MIKRYLFILGRKSDLAFFELTTVLKRIFPNDKIEYSRFEHTAIVKTTAELDASEVIKILGGTVKIAQLGKAFRKKEVIDKTLTAARNESIGTTKLVFGISIIASSDKSLRFDIPKQMKNRLSKEGIASRYVLPRTSDELTSAQVSLGRISEFYLLFKNKNQLSLNSSVNKAIDQVEMAKTIAVQDFSGFSKRDYQRPFSAPKQGMLPPKVARMMVNIAFSKNIMKDSWLLDPFCGTGTIAMEALMLGINTISSDISTTQVAGTKRNLRWLISQENITSSYKVLKQDATQISHEVSRKMDCIVTEPYLGPTSIVKEKIDDVIKGLNKLYLGVMKNIKKILVPGGKVVIALPEITVGDINKSAHLVIDMRENLGYTLVAGPFEYEREKAQVKRLIFVLQRK